MTAEQVLDQLRALTPAERLYVVERIVHEVAAEVTPAAPVATAATIGGDESDAEFEAFQASVERQRSNDVWRSGDAERLIDTDILSEYLRGRMPMLPAGRFENTDDSPCPS